MLSLSLSGFLGVEELHLSLQHDEGIIATAQREVESVVSNALKLVDLTDPAFLGASMFGIRFFVCCVTYELRFLCSCRFCGTIGSKHGEHFRAGKTYGILRSSCTCLKCPSCVSVVSQAHSYG